MIPGLIGELVGADCRVDDFHHSLMCYDWIYTMGHSAMEHISLNGRLSFKTGPNIAY